MSRPLKNYPLVVIYCCLLSWTAVLTSARAQGGPPLITDDTETPGDRRWEIEIAVTSEMRHSDERQFEVPLLDMNYGIGSNVELTYELPLLLNANRDEPSSLGLGNSLTGIKWRFLDEAKTGVSISIYPQYAFNNPTSSVCQGLVADDQELFLPLELQKRSAPWNLIWRSVLKFIFSLTTSGKVVSPWDTPSVISRFWPKFIAQPWTTFRRITPWLMLEPVIQLQDAIVC